MKRILFMVLSCLLIITALPAMTSASSVVNEAHKYLGVPYASGGTSSSGFDCSGFTQRAFSDAGNSIPRTTGAQFNTGTPVDKGSLQAGDLVFFNTSGSGVSHAGIYIGSSNFIHSSSSKGVMISSINDPHYWGSRYIGARRVTGQAAAPKVEKAAEEKVEAKVETVKAKAEPKVEPKKENKPKVEKVEAKVEVAKKEVVVETTVAEVATTTTPDTSKEKEDTTVEITEEVAEVVVHEANFQHLHATAITNDFTFLVRGKEDNQSSLKRTI